MVNLAEKWRCELGSHCEEGLECELRGKKVWASPWSVPIRNPSPSNAISDAPNFLPVLVGPRVLWARAESEALISIIRGILARARGAGANPRLPGARGGCRESGPTPPPGGGQPALSCGRSLRRDAERIAATVIRQLRALSLTEGAKSCSAAGIGAASSSSLDPPPICRPRPCGSSSPIAPRCEPLLVSRRERAVSPRP
jgi:hypothetical protein